MSLPDRLPPHSMEFEQAALGAALISTTAAETLCTTTETAHFYVIANQTIRGAIEVLVSASKPVDVVTVAEWLREHGLLETVGDLPYIYLLTESCTTAAHQHYYCEKVVELARRRALIDLAYESMGWAHDQSNEIQWVIDRVEAGVYQACQTPHFSRGQWTPFPPALAEVRKRIQRRIDRKGELEGLPTGFASLDRMTAGLLGGGLYIIAARPSVGKTSLALQMSLAAAGAGAHVGIATLEMSVFELVERIVCSTARIESQRIRAGELLPGEATRLGECEDRLRELPVSFIDDVRSVAGIRSAARRGKIDMLVIDYLQIMDDPPNSLTRNLAVGKNVSSLKSLARELGIPVVCLSQLSRESQRNEGAVPRLHNLRDSGGIEQDADFVMFIHNPYSESNAERPVTEMCKFIVAKHRNGPTGTIHAGFTRRFARFDEVDDWREEG